MKEVHTVQRKNCLPCGEKTRYRAAVKSAYRAHPPAGGSVSWNPGMQEFLCIPGTAEQDHCSQHKKPVPSLLLNS